MSDATKPIVGQSVHYYAEPNSPEDAYSGPYAAKVVVVHPDPAGEDEPRRVDLAVWFSGRGTHEKTNVPQSAEPTKHHWCWRPSD